ncbi:branched-chain amino acid ABC transporter substrate-binding protein [Sphaerotilus uruguayifluvii]|uniref:ABC transporter substrate binding protein (PQQ-dependent alcohol dehydrogenase system) n=1 Tax=Sphaerotilus uruguayifluvii TaxID=2735897 RepID=A0ABX2G4H9_9BURK|nr:ABC transporter substrate binding protein (PQQ-dependent alcohol dehydrogenase system) [Leptothrix sp. C29]
MMTRTQAKQAMNALRRGAVVLALAGTGALAQAATFKVTLLQPVDDARLERSRLERAYLGHPGGPAADGLQVALKEAKFELEAAGAAIVLDTVPVASAAAAREAAARAEKGGAAVVLADLPADWLLAAADAVKLPVMNLGAAEDRLREADCRARLLHLIPSERMRADALAQTLTSQRWSSVLLLTGPSAQDAQRSAVAQAAIKRYGLKLAAAKPFKLSADPRERDLANPRLLTGNLQYDVVWVVDSDGEFARALPYRTALPRPVVGDAGLTAQAWSAQFERFGAPQVSRRFAKAAGRAMTAHDWSAWMAGKALVAAASEVPKGPAAALAQALGTLEFDGSKGVPMSFRAWDGQLRQPMLMTDGQGVVATAPVEGVQHPRNSLDTLGADAPEKLCKAVR